MTIKELKKRSNAFVKDLDLFVGIAVENVGKQITDLNRKQMLASKLSTGANISPRYSRGYAIFKGFSKPNLRLTGSFQNDMFIDVRAKSKEYFIQSEDEKMPFLLDLYGQNIFGIMQSNQTEAQRLSGVELQNLYKRHVLQK